MSYFLSVILPCFQNLAESAGSDEGIYAPSTVAFEDTEGLSPQDPGPLVLHSGSQCNIKCLQRSSGSVTCFYH